MRKTTKVTGTKIAQAAKDLNVTSVTIRRYISEFNIETTTDENGIKVLPESAMDELQEVRRLKEEGNTNPQVLEFLEERRANGGDEKAEAKPEKEKPKATRARTAAKKEKEVAPAADDDDEEDTPEVADEEEEAPQAKQARRRPAVKKEKVQEVEEQEAPEEAEAETEEAEAPEGDTAEGEGDGDGRLKHSLTCQTCGKTFEHMNPRLRDCLDCYRAKRKERRRGGDRHKNVIQHPLAQQVVSKMANQQQQQQQEQQDDSPTAPAAVASSAPVQRRAPSSQQQQQRRDRSRDITSIPSQNVGVTQPVIGGLKTQVRSYRKAIEETRQITGSLKRRLERPDLPEGDRRWLEQIYAYQLILHQGWRHLSEYRAQTNQQNKED